jgi:transketolase
MKKVPGVDMSTGSLGMGLSVGIGMALAGLLDKKDYYVYVLCGCGEQQEGEIWESAMAAVKFRLNRLIAILDYNHVQLDGRIEEIMPLGDVIGKWRAFGWNVIEVDGHQVNELGPAIEQAKQCPDRPSIIVARTVKGKGVSFMEGKHQWHGQLINDEHYQQAMAELNAE